jgi:myo-inositol-1-phosphate synthase
MTKIGVLIPGISGAVASTLVVGLSKSKKDQIATGEWGSVTYRYPAAALPLLDVSSLVFGGWDIIPPDPPSVVAKYRVFSDSRIAEDFPASENPYYFPAIVTKGDYEAYRGTLRPNVQTPLEALEQLVSDIKRFRKDSGTDRTVIVNLASPPRNLAIEDWHQDWELFSSRLHTSWEGITSGMLYCLAAIETGSPFVEFTPSETVTLGALQNRALSQGVALAGRDASTGQTLLKTVLAELIDARNLRLESWYSTNILGNNDGLVLSDPDFAGPKISDKMAVLGQAFSYPFDHVVDIRFVRAKGDRKEAWDSIDLRGWLDQPISLKINWLGRDSVLAAPLVLDLIRLIEFCQRREMRGIQPQLGLFFKRPVGASTWRFSELYREFVQFCESSATMESDK